MTEELVKAIEELTEAGEAVLKLCRKQRPWRFEPSAKEQRLEAAIEHAKWVLEHAEWETVDERMKELGVIDAT